MITIQNGKLTIPENERFIGFAGDNLRRKIEFSVQGESTPCELYRIFLTFDDGTVNFFTLEGVECDGTTTLVWNVLDEHIFKSGLVKVQIKAFSQNNVIWHTNEEYFVVGESAECADFFKNKENSEFLRYEQMLNTLKDEIEAERVLLPYIGENGNWYLYDAEIEEYVDSGKKSMGELEDNSVTHDKIASGAVKANKLGQYAVTAEAIAFDAVETEKIKNGAVTSEKLADGSVNSAKLATKSVLGYHINGSAVQTNHIADGAVTEEKFADFSISNSKLKANSVTIDKILDNAVTSSKIMNGSVKSEKLADGSVNSEKLAGASIDYYHLKYGAVHPEALDRTYLRFNNMGTVPGIGFHNLLLQNADELAEPYAKMHMFVSRGDDAFLTSGTGRCVGFYVSSSWFQFKNLNTGKTYNVKFNENEITAFEEVEIYGGTDSAVGDIQKTLSLMVGGI